MLNHGHILSAAEMRSAEQAMIDDGISNELLMQRAGNGAAQMIWRVSSNMPTLVLCGQGNNGGDGYIIAEWLRQKGVVVSVAATSPPKTNVAKIAKAQWQGDTIPLKDAEPASQLVDCLFGTGLSRPIAGDIYQQYLRLLKGVKRKIALDVPSGIETDSGKSLNEIPAFDMTIALGAFKPAHFLAPAKALMGNIVGVDFGVSADSQMQILSRPLIQSPSAADHKYTRGLIAVVAGVMPGAASLTALAAQHAGAGYVKLFTSEDTNQCHHSIVSQQVANLETLSDELNDPRISIIVAGPGLGRGAHSLALLDMVLNVDKPLLLDADALVLLGKQFATRLRHRNYPVIVTPHDGEFRHIHSSSSVNKVAAARALANTSNCVVLLKGSDTVVADADGRASLTPTANHWLSIAGTGDVLAGIIAARYGAEKEAYTATLQGQWLHSRAAQLAGPAFTPERLIEMIPDAIRECL